jgi:hypothetical protein
MQLCDDGSGPSERAPQRLEWTIVTPDRESNDLRQSLWGVALEIVVSIRHDPVAIRPGFSFKKASQTRLLSYLNAAGVITQCVLTVPNLSLMRPGERRAPVNLFRMCTHAQAHARARNH